MTLQKNKLKTQITLNKKDNYLMNVWKPIDQVVLPHKKVYKYILDQNKGYWRHMELIHFMPNQLIKPFLKIVLALYHG